jgi:hypothetical protein
MNDVTGHKGRWGSDVPIARAPSASHSGKIPSAGFQVPGKFGLPDISFLIDLTCPITASGRRKGPVPAN